MKTVAGRFRGLLMLLVVVLAWPIPAWAAEGSRFAGAAGTMPVDQDAVSRPTPFAPSSLDAGALSANFLGETPSDDARRVGDWVVLSGDNDGLPFIIIDKIRAKVFVFDSSGRLRGAAFALLGKARGDDSIPGIGSRKLSTIRPEERTTPAGRFVASLGHDLERDILWIDYGASISLHRVITGTPGDRRLERLATTSALDKRISYGCVNVPVAFYEDVVLKIFAGTTGIVYILPETKTIQEVFGMSLEVDATGKAKRRSR